MWRAVLVCVWVCVWEKAGAAASTSLVGDRRSLSQARGWSRRYCSCHDKGNRYNMTYQTCTIKQDSFGGLLCNVEALPFVDQWYRYNPGVRGLFRVFNNPMPFYDAENVCDEEYARLAVPMNRDGLNAIYDTMKMYGEKHGLLGSADRRVEGTFVDPDGSRPPYLPWGRNRPDNYFNEDCVLLQEHNEIEDIPCYWNALEFVCERRMNTIPKGYSYDWTQRRFYKLYDEKRSHAAARRRCQEDGGTLVAFESWPAARVTRELLFWRSKSDVVWADYTDQQRNRRFVTSTGMLMEDTDYINWYPGQPDNGGGKGRPENCVAIWKTGEYADEDCNKQIPFLCQIKTF